VNKQRIATLTVKSRDDLSGRQCGRTFCSEKKRGKESIRGAEIEANKENTHASVIGNGENQPAGQTGSLGTASKRDPGRSACVIHPMEYASARAWRARRFVGGVASRLEFDAE
jgi:hypothetical protein